MPDPWIVEVEPGGYLVDLGHKIEVTGDGTRCTSFFTHERAQELANRFYEGREMLRPPRIFQPDWLKEKGETPVGRLPSRRKL